MNWISVDDYLPPFDHYVLAHSQHEIRTAFIDRIKDDGEPFWTYYDYLEMHDVTHWMELPKPPNCEKVK